MSEEQAKYQLRAPSPNTIKAFDELIDYPEPNSPTLPNNQPPGANVVQRNNYSSTSHSQYEQLAPRLPIFQQNQPSQVPYQAHQWFPQPLQPDQLLPAGYRAQIISNQGVPVQDPSQICHYSRDGSHWEFYKSRLKIYDWQLPPLPERLGFPSPRAGHSREEWNMRAGQFGVPAPARDLWIAATSWDDVPWRKDPPPLPPPPPPSAGYGNTLGCELPTGLNPPNPDQEGHFSWSCRARAAKLRETDIEKWWNWARNRQR